MSFTETVDLDHMIDPELLELYEVLEFLEHPSVMEDFVPPVMNSPLMAVPLPAGFVSRQQWGARAPRSTTRLTTAQGNTAHYEGPYMGPYTHASCPTKVRGIQKFHMDTRGWADVAYSDIECIHGGIFDCRGYGFRTAANGTNVGNDKSYAHCVLIGEGDAFTDAARAALAAAFGYYEHRGSGGRRWVHGDWKATACPGGPVRDFVRNGLIVPQHFEPTPAAPDQPAIPPMTLLSELEIDPMQVLKTFSVSVGTTPAGQPNAGCGWTEFPFSRDQIVGHTVGGNRPAADGRYNAPKIAFAYEGDHTIVQVTEADPGWPVVCTISVAE